MLGQEGRKDPKKEHRVKNKASNKGKIKIHSRKFKSLCLEDKGVKNTSSKNRQWSKKQA